MKVVLALALVVTFTLSGCTSIRRVTRSQVSLAGTKAQTKEGITISATVTDLVSVQKDPRLFKTVPAVQRTSEGAVERNIGWILLNPPVLELRVTNETGHVIRFNGAVIAMIDGAGNRYESTTKDRLAAEQRSAIALLARQGTVVTPAGQAELERAARGLKLLDDNVQLLPSRADTYFLSFDLPVEPTLEAVNAWLAEQSSLQLAIYEVPVETNEAGTVTKRTAFEFPLVVKTFRDTYEDKLFQGSRLLSSVEIKK